MWIHDRIKPKNYKPGRPFTHVQTKMNGYRYTLFKQKVDLLAFGRKTDDKNEKSEILQDYEWYKIAKDSMPPQSSLDGELYVPGHPPTDVPTAMKERWPNLKFAVFAIPWWESFSRDLLPLPETEALLNRRCPEIEFASFREGQSTDTVVNLFKEIKDKGIEGYVLKMYNYKHWWKLKPRLTIDCIVTGTKDGKEKYIGMLGSLLVSVYKEGELVEIAKVSGMTDDQRLEMSEKDIGRVVEVEYQTVGAKGRLIHSAFNRFRDDKPENECTWEDQVE